MKTFNILHIILLLLCMLLYKCARGQEQDFLITSKADTIEGDIKLLFYGPEKKVQVIGADKKKAVYSILQTRSFRYNGEVYHPLKGPSGYTFMKLLKDGYLSLYAFQPEGQSLYEGLFLVKKDGGTLEVPNLGFKKQMVKFLENCEGVSTKIDQGTFTRKELELIIDEYNQCIDSRSIIVERVIAPKPPQKDDLNTWNILEENIMQHSDFSGKTTALEMITEIKNKISRSEKIPQFMVDGLSNTLSGQDDLKTMLENAIASIKK